MKSEIHARGRLTTEEAEKFLANILNKKEKISFDPHTTVYSYFIGCDPARLQDEKFITATILSSIVQARMRLESFSLTKFEGGGGGITAVAVVSDSHIIVNTFPETTSLILDVYACSGSPINVLHEFLRRFKPANYSYVIFPRVMEEKESIILSGKEIEDKKTREWAIKRKILPLINTSEEAAVLANLFGFILGNGKLANKIVVKGRSAFILQLLKDKIRLKLGISSKSLVLKDFTLEIRDSRLIKLMKALSKVFLKKNSSKALAGCFLASFLYSRLKWKNGYAILHLKRGEDALEIRKLLSEFKINCSGKKELKIKLTKENLLRLQAILSLNKIFPLGMLTPNIKIKPAYKLYPLNAGFYRIIDLLVEKKAISFKSLSSRWLRILKRSNIVKLNGKIVSLNI